MKNKRIGGEYFITPSNFFSKKFLAIEDYARNRFPGKHHTFTGGGYFSILTILKNIGFKESEEVLLPSYICPTVILPFKKLNIPFRFYKVDKNLSISLQDLAKKLTTKVKAIFFVNYFGFPQPNNVRNYFSNLKRKGFIIIEDIVHSFFSNFKIIGDYAFNSFRKFMPVDGSIILSDRALKCPKGRLYTKYFLYQLAGRCFKYINIKLRLNLDKVYLGLFKEAEKNYYKCEFSSFNRFNKFIFSRLNISKICEKRIVTFKLLLSEFKSIALFKQLPDKVIPLSFPIILANRNHVRNNLMEKNIFCPVHWKLSEEINEDQNWESCYLSNHSLSIPLSQEINDNHISVLKNILNDS